MLMVWLLWQATMDPVDSGEAGRWLVLILAGGGAVGIYTLVRAYLAVRNNVETREATAIGNLERWMEESNRRAEDFLQQLDACREVSAYWRLRAVRAEHALTQAGLPLPHHDHPPNGI